MKLQQILRSCLERWQSISGLDFCLLDANDQILLFLKEHRLPAAQKLADFRASDALCVSNTTCHIFRVHGEEDLEWLLLVYGSDENAPVIGELAVCQIESLITAYAEKNDKNTFMQNLLLGRYLETESFNKARRLHISTSAPRVVYLLETKQKSDEVVQSLIRNIFNSRTRDFITALDDTELIIIHEVQPGETLDKLSETASMLVDMLNTEVMTSAWVSYSNVAEDLSQLSNAYKEAQTALAVGKIFNADHNVFGYRRLGIGRLIYQLPDEICEIFIEEIFKEDSIDSLDEETLNTIRTFFQNNLNLSETSRQLYVHRNTLVYRFEKLQKKFGLDIRTFEDAVIFKLAMMVSNYLKYRANEANKKSNV